MTSHTKIAVTVPARTLRGVEAQRKRLGRTRSSIVAEALEAWLHRQGLDERDRAYLAGYRRVPEADDADVAAAVIAIWDAWDDDDRSSTKRRSRARKRP
jgi:hypothetical protein